MDWRYAETLAEDLLRGELDEPPSVAALVRRELGEGAVQYASCVPGDAALVRVGEVWRIYVRRRLPRQRLAFALVHELAELRMHGQVREDIEQVANYAAAAVLVPRGVVRRARGYAELAQACRVSETLAALREAEVTMRPRAVLSPALVRVRGPESYVWPSERQIRRLARVRLSDDPRRYVLDPSDDDGT
jgi:hypothetical protein